MIYCTFNPRLERLSLPTHFPQVVDLLIAMANAAAQSARCNLILDPYPSIVDPKNTSQLALDPKVQ